ncbi:Hypothetical_protein [Hexamita inflata]|uniref:Hypothetical_protein n=1 Tax=Hexamita inflata TaxID=28002 RepID=A0AA86RC51_9EUKA|nr:Hypothetical protein HINF_LOCUS62901 [Hexamita inflata]
MDYVSNTELSNVLINFRRFKLSHRLVHQETNNRIAYLLSNGRSTNKNKLAVQYLEMIRDAFPMRENCLLRLLEVGRKRKQGNTITIQKCNLEVNQYNLVNNIRLKHQINEQYYYIVQNRFIEYNIYINEYLITNINWLKYQKLKQIKHKYRQPVNFKNDLRSCFPTLIYAYLINNIIFIQLQPYHVFSSIIKFFHKCHP